MAREKDYGQYLLNWPYEYMHMKDPVIRKKILDESIKQGVDPEGDKLRSMLWERRYPKGIDEDEYFKAWMYFDFVAEEINAFFGKKKRLNNVKQHLERIGIYAMKEFGELGEQILYEELYHLVYNYIQLCADDRNYGSVILGFGKMNKDSYALKVAKNLRRVCYIPAEGFGLQEEFSLLQKAAMEAYYDAFPEYDELYDKVINKSVEE